MPTFRPPSMTTFPSVANPHFVRNHPHFSAKTQKINPPVAGVRSLIEPAANSELAAGTLPGFKPERQDAFGGPIRACRGSATGVTANHARHARSGSSAGARAKLKFRLNRSGIVL